MKTFKTIFSRCAAIGLITATAALCGAQTSNTIVAEFGTAPAAGQNFTVNLVNTGSENEIAGFAFKLLYDPSQVSIAGVANNTGQSASRVQYTLGAETTADNAKGTAQRILTATTVKDLQDASKLVEIKFEKKAGFVPPFKFNVADRATEPIIDGLQGASLKNIPHAFDTSAVNK